MKCFYYLALVAQLELVHTTLLDTEEILDVVILKFEIIDGAIGKHAVNLWGVFIEVQKHELRLSEHKQVIVDFLCLDNGMVSDYFLNRIVVSVEYGNFTPVVNNNILL